MATNEKRVQGRYLNLVAADPANPASGALCRYGTMIGIAIVTGAGGLAFPIDFGPAVYNVSVKGQNVAGNTAVAAGDVLYYTDGQTFLDKKVTGYAAGTALAAVTSGATTSIDVALGRYGAEGGADVPAGSITGAMLASNIAIATSGSITSSGPTGGGIGYATGAGGAVTQVTNRSTGVTLSKLTGTITTRNDSLAGLAAATFIVTNTTVAIGDTVVVSIQSGSNGGNTNVFVSVVAAGSFSITVANGNPAAGTAETGAILINFAVIKAVSA